MRLLPLYMDLYNLLGAFRQGTSQIGGSADDLGLSVARRHGPRDHWEQPRIYCLADLFAVVL